MLVDNTKLEEYYYPTGIALRLPTGTKLRLSTICLEMAKKGYVADMLVCDDSGEPYITGVEIDESSNGKNRTLQCQECRGT